MAKKGAVIEVSDKLGKAWLKAGLVSKADSNAEPTVATTSPKPTPKTPEKVETDTTGEVVDDKQNSDGGDQSDATADKEPTTGDEVKTDDEPTEPQAPVAPATEPVEPKAPTAPVAPQNNSNQNTKKGSK